jgi:hypothetical protein
VCAVLARIVQAVTSDPPRFQDNVRRHGKVAEQIFASFDSVDFRGDDFAKPPNWNPAPSPWGWKKIPIPPGCSPYQSIGHVVRREGKLVDPHQDIALGCGAARRTCLRAIDVGKIDEEIRRFYPHGSRILQLHRENSNLKNASVNITNDACREFCFQ